jgi:Notch-like protein
MAVGVFPELLKYSKVKPLYKKGGKSCIYNYRPISLLTVFSKTFEKVMYKRVTF